MLELKAVSKSFGATRAVDDVSLSIETGERIGIIGRSGAGKSTLIRLINRLVAPESGQILYHETDVLRLRGRALKDWRAKCAMIFQQFQLIDRLDVITNVLVGCLAGRPFFQAMIKSFGPEDRARAILELDRLDLTQTVFQKAGTLSGGQKQRVAIARALMQDPELILADEPVASLDPRNTQVVMDQLRAINTERGITIVINLHSLDLARSHCSRIIGMAGGRIVFDGRPDELGPDALKLIYGADMSTGAETQTASSEPRLAFAAGE